MKKQRGSTSADGVIAFALLALVLAAFVGWVMNIVKIAGADFGDITGVLVLRVVGVFMAPVGAVLGFI